MIAIFGSGFGLYGYLPAIVEGCGQRVVLLERYYEHLCQRPELARFLADVRWEQSETDALDCADGVVLALRPFDQEGWIRQCLARANIQRMVLEKPLARSPAIARELSVALCSSPKVIRVGYTFRYTPWAKNISHALASTGKKKLMFLQWAFLAHHFRYNVCTWKRRHSLGGGVIRFYGIQLIALLAEIGYRDVIRSRCCGKRCDEVERWTASLAGSGLPECEIEVDSRAAEAAFRVGLVPYSAGECDGYSADLAGPFDPGSAERQPSPLDERVPSLVSLCRSLWQPTTTEYGWYEAAIALWQCIEAKTDFEVA